MKTLEEILAMSDESAKIELLKTQRKTPMPRVGELMKEWNPDMHEVNDKNLRKDGELLVSEEKDVTNSDGTVTHHAAVYEPDPVNRISIPLEQDIVNIHTAFTVGKDPNVNCTPNDEAEKSLLQIIKSVVRKNKMRYNNKRIVRSLFCEQDVAEYWYAVKDNGFWTRAKAKIKGLLGYKNSDKYKLRCAIWSPFRGDALYPFFDANGDYVALSRAYTIKDNETKMEVQYFMTVTSTNVYTWRLDAGAWTPIPEMTFAHGFKKNPTMYMHRNISLCHNIQAIRRRIEELLSNYADCVDMVFFPNLIVEGDLEGLPQKVGKNRMIQIQNSGKVYYLNLEQVGGAAKVELENLLDMAYQLTNTPRLSLDNMKGLGSVPSGRAFDFLFMGTQLAVDNHAEIVGEYLQRRYNFLASAIGSLNPAYEDAANTIDIDVEIQPFNIDDLEEKVRIATEACGQPVASLRTGVMLAGIVDNIDDEVREIEESKTQQSANNAFEVTY